VFITVKLVAQPPLQVVSNQAQAASIAINNTSTSTSPHRQAIHSPSTAYPHPQKRPTKASIARQGATAPSTYSIDNLASTARASTARASTDNKGPISIDTLLKTQASTSTTQPIRTDDSAQRPATTSFLTTTRRGSPYKPIVDTDKKTPTSISTAATTNKNGAHH